MTLDLMALAERTIERAKALGADEVVAAANHGSSVEVGYRDGELEDVREAISSSISISVFVDGRYSSHATSDLRPEALEAFVQRAVTLTRLLSPDPHRGLPDPALYENRPEVDLELFDPSHGALDIVRRRALAEAGMEAARGMEGPIVSVSSGWRDSVGQSVRVHSNGFAGRRETTSFGLGVQASVREADGRRPEDWSSASARFLSDLPDPAEVGREAARRALARPGQRKLESGRTTLVLENRVAGRLVGTLLSALSGGALHQRRTFLLDRLGETIGSPKLTLIDDPLVPRGSGSRCFDHEGISSRRRTLVEAGALREYLIDVYYARKLGVAPTGGSTSNVLMPPGTRDQAAIVAGLERGILVTSLLGGNADLATGDFSHGLAGFEIRDGALAGPVGEMNVTGSHAEVWKHLAEVGSDPYPYGSYRLPTLVFEGLDVSGS